MTTIKKSSHIRSILKGISWRFVATTDTIVVVLLITCFIGECSLESSLKIGAYEFLLKLAVFYFHERIWLRILGKQATTNKEILYKSVSWRFIASLMTFVISGIILYGFDEVALCIAITELFTKMILYYVHEKIWLKLPLGKIRNFFLGRKIN